MPDAGNRQLRSRSLDPSGKRALFDTPVTAPPEALRGGARSGRAALFSTGPREPGTVVVDCSGCDARTRVGLGDIAIRLASFSLYAPLLQRRHPHRMKCPTCHETTWCRIGWTE